MYHVLAPMFRGTRTLYKVGMSMSNILKVGHDRQHGTQDFTMEVHPSPFLFILSLSPFIRPLSPGASILWGNDARCVTEVSGGGGKKSCEIL